jgi:hypothetical protein
MAAYLIEVWGVYLGMVRPFMGGILVIPASRGTVSWTWGYDGPVAALDAAREEGR